MADLGWACRPVNLFMRHADALLDEFMVQGDLEKQIGVPVHPFGDREGTSRSKSQLAYMCIIVAPYVNAFTVCVPYIQKELLKQNFGKNSHEQDFVSTI